ncbi:MAG: hypothetical protein ACOVOU_03615, partial [Rubrivivax sp.]
MSTASPAAYFLRPDPKAESTLGLGGWWARRLRELTLRALGRATVAGGGSTHRRQALALWNSLQPDAGIDGAPAPALVANAGGMVDLFNSNASKTLLNTPKNAGLAEAYYKAFLYLNAA